jgi:predicted ATPase
MPRKRAIEDDSRAHLSAFVVNNYKAFSKSTLIEFGDLTIFTGANSSGKSSVMEPLLLLKQTLDSTTDPGALDIDGSDISMASFEGQLLSKINKDRDSFAVSLILSSGQTVSLEFVAGAYFGVALRNMYVSDGDTSMTLREGMSENKIQELLSDDAKSFLRLLQANESFKSGKLEVVRDRCFLDVVLTLRADTQFPIYPMGAGPGDRFREELRNIVHVPALRYNLERLRPISKSHMIFPGEFDDYAASLIYSWQINKSAKLRQAERDLTLLGVANKLRAQQISDVEVALSINRGSSTKDMIDLSEVGLGVAQVLPVVTALHAVADRRIVYIEEPESHLHPNAQYALAKVLAGAIRRGVRVVIETHSSLLLLGLQEMVALGEIDAEKTRLHWFQRDPSDGHVEVTSGTMGEAGTLDGWPNDFATAAVNAQRQFLTAFEKRSISSSRS